MVLSTMLSEMLSRVATEFTYARGKPFKNSAFGNFVRKEIAEEAKKRLIFLPFEMTVKASVGNGNWAAVPWLAFFDPLITTTATRGYYIVYLINPQSEKIFLSLNQGTTAVDEEFGVKTGRDVLRRRARDIALRVSDFSRHFDDGPIDLGSDATLPSGYVAGHAFGREYDARNINTKDFNSDLEKMLFAYEALIDRGGTSPTDAMIEEAGNQGIEETRRYVLSKRIERAPSVRRQVLAKRGTVCEGCGLNPKTDYVFSGRPDQTPLDVHHSKPLQGLAEGETRRYEIPRDFLVLCPNCHRMIHKQDDPSDLSQLKKRIRFKYMRDIGVGSF
ncbi:DUF3578 domain-containing protein [Octadecabacter sp. SW4]|uniref:MrcB family domain-containing protein n=1 Tax=Octadecabacter sp. SW4 TaxID=2602067 RepID=UPI0011C1DEE1|nr:DUF3578 domain-containing protein [Octadecabacter sp. SW4]QEE34234.1 DUF3578 domain-containing protein [Octadecabacter sp. SW4]